MLLIRNRRTSSKVYVANRNNVQEALTGIIYGYPAGGLANLDNVEDADLCNILAEIMLMELF